MHEVPGHRLDARADRLVDDHALDAVDHRRHAVRRVADVAAEPPAPPGRNGDITPASRSAQSLGRKVRPSLVMPWMKTSRRWESCDAELRAACCSAQGYLVAARSSFVRGIAACAVRVDAALSQVALRIASRPAFHWSLHAMNVPAPLRRAPRDEHLRPPADRAVAWPRLPRVGHRRQEVPRRAGRHRRQHARPRPPEAGAGAAGPDRASSSTAPTTTTCRCRSSWPPSCASCRA